MYKIRELIYDAAIKCELIDSSPQQTDTAIAIAEIYTALVEIECLLEDASRLIGNPSTKDSACDEWHENHKSLISK